MRRRALLLAAPALFSCGPKAIGAPPAAPALLGAADLIPPDLDVVVRLDQRKLRQALGAAQLREVARQALAKSSSDELGGELLIESLLAADVVYLGYRPDQHLAPLDRVLALQGHFEQLVEPPLGFGRAVDLGADTRYFERRVQRSLERGAVARIYTVSTRLRCFVSEAELDAMERLLALGGAERRLAPPEQGTLSLAARPALLQRFAGRGALGELLAAAQSLALVLDVVAGGVELELELGLGRAEDAERLAGAGRAVLERLGGPLAARAALRVVAERVLLTARFEPEDLAPLVACLHGGSGCPW